jgi:hypothetical protein
MSYTIVHGDTSLRRRKPCTGAELPRVNQRFLKVPNQSLPDAADGNREQIPVSIRRGDRARGWRLEIGSVPIS